MNTASVNGLVILLFIIDVLSVAVVGLGAIGALKRNRLVGLRLNVIMSSDEAWRRGHRAGFLPLLIGILVSGGFGVAAMIAAGQNAEFGGDLMVCQIITLLGGVFWSGSRARRAAERTAQKSRT